MSGMKPCNNKHCLMCTVQCRMLQSDQQHSRIWQSHSSNYSRGQEADDMTNKDAMPKQDAIA